MAGAVWSDSDSHDWRLDSRNQSIVMLMARLDHYERVIRMIARLSAGGTDQPDSDLRMALKLIACEAREGLYEWEYHEI